MNLHTPRGGLTASVKGMLVSGRAVRPSLPLGCPGVGTQKYLHAFSVPSSPYDTPVHLQHSNVSNRQKLSGNMLGERMLKSRTFPLRSKRHRCHHVINGVG